MKTEVICKSGNKGYRQFLRDEYKFNKAQFKTFCEVQNIHGRLGYATPEEAWNANPMIEASNKPSDLRIINEETPVIFRKFKDGQVIAIFPYNTERKYGTCESYMRLGQHGTADLGIIHDTMPATEEEYRDLYLELSNYGPAEANYNLKVIKRINWDMYKKAHEKQNRREPSNV